MSILSMNVEATLFVVTKIGDVGFFSDLYDFGEKDGSCLWSGPVADYLSTKL